MHGFVPSRVLDFAARSNGRVAKVMIADSTRSLLSRVRLNDAVSHVIEHQDKSRQSTMIQLMSAVRARDRAITKKKF